MNNSPNNSNSPHLRETGLTSSEADSPSAAIPISEQLLVSIKVYKTLYMFLAVIGLLGLIYITAVFMGAKSSEQDYEFFDIGFGFVSVWIYGTIWWGLSSRKRWCPLLILVIAPFRLILGFLEIGALFNSQVPDYFSLVGSVISAVFYGSQIFVFSKAQTRQHFKAGESSNEGSKSEVEFDPSKRVDSSQDQFPSILRRYLATFVDGFLIIVAVIAISFMLSQDSEVAIKIRVGVILLMFFVYEPFCTSKLYTIGQKMTGIRVRRIADGKRISLPLAYIRIVFKLFLGMISFFTIPFSKERRAIHDIVVGSVVVRGDSVAEQVKPVG